MNTETPETDAEFAKKRTFPAGFAELQDFARKLEQERDEALSECERLEIMTAEKAAELHQLRAVCDELATELDHETLHKFQSSKVADALDSYKSLPHVKAKGNKP